MDFEQQKEVKVSNKKFVFLYQVGLIIACNLFFVRTYDMNIQSTNMSNLVNFTGQEYTANHKVDLSSSQELKSVAKHDLKHMSGGYDIRSMTSNERIAFANEAVSSGVISLKEAGALLPPEVQRVEGPNGFTIQEQPYPKNHRFNVLEELKNSIDFSKQNGGSKGIEIRENLLAKLEHLSQGSTINLTA